MDPRYTRDLMAHFPVDFSIDLNSVNRELLECKMRYHREVWRVICDKALSLSGGDTGASWRRKEPEPEPESESDPEPEPVPAPKPAQKPEPVPEPVPEPAPKQEAKPEPKPEPKKVEQKPQPKQDQKAKPADSKGKKKKKDEDEDDDDEDDDDDDEDEEEEEEDDDDDDDDNANNLRLGRRNSGDGRQLRPRGGRCNRNSVGGYRRASRRKSPVSASADEKLSPAGALAATNNAIAELAGLLRRSLGAEAFGGFLGRDGGGGVDLGGCGGVGVASIGGDSSMGSLGSISGCREPGRASRDLRGSRNRLNSNRIGQRAPLTPQTVPSPSAASQQPASCSMTDSDDDGATEEVPARSSNSFLTATGRCQRCKKPRR